MVSGVELIGEEDILKKGGAEKKRKNYKRYNDVVDRINLIGWVKGEIEKKPEKMIVVKIDDVVKEMGPDFKNADYNAVYQALKVIFFQNGIFLSMATHKDGDKTFLLRYVKEGDQLASSYLFVKKRIKKKYIKRKRMLEKGETDEKDEKVEKGEKDDQEKIAMREEIKKLREILSGRLGKKSCMIEIFQFNWNTLTWRMIKRSSARTHLKLLQVLMDNTSSVENRYRIEITLLDNAEKDISDDKDIVKEGEKGEIHGMDISCFETISEELEELTGSEKEQIDETSDTEKEKDEKLQDKKLECPRCGSKNINSWDTAQIIKTRSGNRGLKHRCADCNETFTDEEMGIKE